jgi:hypothetical protein
VTSNRGDVVDAVLARNEEQDIGEVFNRSFFTVKWKKSS